MTSSIETNVLGVSREPSVDGDSSVRHRLNKWRTQLLDLTSRNRLIHTPLDQARTKLVRVVDEISQHIFQILVADGKAMTFLPARGTAADGEIPAADGSTGLPQPEDNEVDEKGIPRRHTDTRLQTNLSSESLQKRLLGIHTDARTFAEEQGVNVLYLALGFLEWYESSSSDCPRFAPLILVPVELDRKTAGSRFALRALEHDIVANLSLQAKLRADFGLELPSFDTDVEVNPNKYFAKVAAAVETQPRWRVHPDEIIVGFFSFAKYLMYRDLDPDSWTGDKRLEQHPLISGLLNGGLRTEPALYDADEPIDRHLAVADMAHIVDCDSSQAVVVEEVRRGRSLVIQGPPGTGKSQTIANIIATAVKDGKKVLFVAEKMAALDVVKRRLNNVGLGSMCLELHSNKTNKKLVVEALGQTLDADLPSVPESSGLLDKLTHTRDRLNTYVEEMHRRFEPANITPYQVIGEFVRLQHQEIGPQSFRLEKSLEWSATDLNGREALLEEVVTHMRQIGMPTAHPWRGAMLAAVLPVDVQRIAKDVADGLQRLDAALSGAEFIAKQLRTSSLDWSQRSILTLLNLHNCLAAAPPICSSALSDPVWEQRRGEIATLARQGQRLTELQALLNPLVTSAAWTTDVTAVRLDLAAYGGSPLRNFHGSYRQSMAVVRGLLKVNAPRSASERLQIVDALLEGQELAATISQPSVQELGQKAFGTQWHGAASDWEALARIEAWEAKCRADNLPSTFRQIFASAAGTDRERAAQLAIDVDTTTQVLHELFRRVELDLPAAFACDDLNAVCFREIRARLTAWRNLGESLSHWIAFRSRWERMALNGLAPLAELLFNGDITPESAIDRLRMAYFETLLREMYRRSPTLAEFSGASHEQSIKLFRTLDQARIKLARYEVAQAHYMGIPRHGGDSGELSVLRREMGKKRGHKPLRKLFREIGHVLQSLKPVFMMSPISVAQFLEPGCIEFDLLLIDEASQVRPVDAIGAIARARQVVVVGDDKQLPPTQFFDAVMADGTDDEEEDFSAGDLESILGLCSAQGVPSRMLRWHYRSRHESLIAVSNREFYDSRLFIVPSPVAESDALGLRFNYIQDGMYDRGGSATNRAEARAVAQAIIRHAATCPDRSLGVGAFSMVQRDAIRDELELLRRSHQDLESFFAVGGAEPFFIKNLENIQGDERDVIFISVGFGKDSSGYMTMGLGPLNRDGGERRLNVLITRAKQRCEVFSSITADDIDQERTKSRGAAALKAFLLYAQRGVLDVATATGRDFDSEFERQVARAVTSLGFEIEPQVGIAGFFIDLAVRDPVRRGRYILGIECDGASYHSSRSARDRDRLRQQVLEDRGWRIHRIWSTDWFQRPEEQLRRVLAAIEDARVTDAKFCPVPGTVAVVGSSAEVLATV